MRKLLAIKSINKQVDYISQYLMKVPHKHILEVNHCLAYIEKYKHLLQNSKPTFKQTFKIEDDLRLCK